MEIDQNINNRKTANSVTRFGQIISLIKSIFIGALFVSVGIGLFVFFINEKIVPLIAYILPAAFIIVPFYGLFYSIFVVKKRNPRKLKPSQDTPFQGTDMLSTKTLQPYAKVAQGSNVDIAAWFGPADRLDLKGLNKSLLGTEFINGAENTLFFNKSQLIAFALIQKDFNELNDTSDNNSSGLKDMASQLSSVAGEASTQQINLQGLQMNKWPLMVDKIKQTGLEKELSSHFNFAIPLNDIEKVEAKVRFFNPGLYIHLKSGVVMKYATFQKEAVAKFVEDAQDLGITIQ
jgi:hypothetical protein